MCTSSRVTNQSVIAVQVFDQKKFKKKDQGFLGVINVQVGNVFDLDIGGDGKWMHISLFLNVILTLLYRNADT